MSTTLPAWRPSHFGCGFPEGQRQAPRCEVQLRVSLRCYPLSTADGEEAAAALTGETTNLSEIGVAVRLPSIRIDHSYLNVVGTQAQLTLDLPAGPVSMRVTPRWCQKISKDEESDSYLIGLRITEMSDEAWVSLVRYVQARV